MTDDARKAPDAAKTHTGTEQTAGRVDAGATKDGIDPKLRQMIIIEAVKMLGLSCEAAVVPVARNNCILSAGIQGSAPVEPASVVAFDEILVRTAVDELSETSTLTKETLRAIRVRFDDAAIRKLVLIVSLFNLLSLLLSNRPLPKKADDRIHAAATPLH